MGEVDERPQGRLMLHILLAFAEFERDMIVERTQAGKAIARTKAGFREGRPPIDKARKEAAVDMILKGEKSYKEAAAAVGISKSTLIRAVRAKKAEVSADSDSFYSDRNIRYLETKMEDYKAGRMKLVEHALIDG
jgi:DNA invertase Pin-like site-specific DNA recombinase